jgi:RNAse (barnase) inhibitor barstar
MPHLLTERRIKAILKIKIKNQKLVDWIWNLMEKYKKQPIKIDFINKGREKNKLKL